MLLGYVEKEKFCSQIWSRMNVPKLLFILWLTVKNQLLTKSRAKKFMRIDDVNCGICGIHDETTEPLFFKCSNSTICLEKLRIWLGWRYRAGELHGVLRWIQRACLSEFRKQVFIATIAALVYCDWQQRNKKLWQQDREGAAVVQKIKTLAKLRVNINEFKCNVEDCKWFVEL